MTKKFENLTYEDFRQMAQDKTLSPYERSGFPDAYRAGYDEQIFSDIRSKLPALDENQQRVLDIGPGCTPLSALVLGHCRQQGHTLTLVDSEEMLQYFPDEASLRKVPGFFPDCFDVLQSEGGGFDVIICYSVLHYIFVEASFWRFLDFGIKLLNNGGSLLIGDIPNISKRKRFFSSETGVRFHKEFMKTDTPPIVERDVVEVDKIDDSVLIGMIMRARAQGCDAYWLPQAPTLPMANRREDLLVTKP